VSRLHLTFACGDYDRTRALEDGSARPDGIDLTYLRLPVEETFFRMLRHREFDVAEMSLSTYVATLDGDTRPFVALPVFTSRMFRHGGIYINANAGISAPSDLRGKRIATTRGSIGHYLLLRVLEANHLKSVDVQISFLSPGDTKAAFDSGSIDAWSTWTPYVPTALAGGARIVADGANYFNYNAFDVANAQSVVTKRTLLADFLRRETAAYIWAKSHPSDYAQVLAKETEEALKESEERYRQLVELSPDAIIVHSEGKFTYLNPAAQKLWAASCAEDLIGTPVLDLVHPDYRDVVKKRLAQLEQFGQPGPLMEEKSIRLDGQVIYR